MLKNNLYNIQSFNYKNEALKAIIQLNTNHLIFKGHFPDVPVLPGVIMMQIVKDLVEVGEEKLLNISKVGNMKFLQMVNPEKNNLLEFEVKIIEKSDEKIRIKAQSIISKDVCFKMSAHLSIVK